MSRRNTGVLFGRLSEQRNLNRDMEALAEGSGRVVWISGEPGIGKTALVQYLKEAARLLGMDFLSGGVGSTPCQAPFEAWVPVVRVLQDDGIDPDGIDPTEQPFLDAVVPGDRPPAGRLTGMTPVARLHEAASRLSRLIARRQRGREPLIIALEDCDRMDSASWRLIRRVAQDQPRVLIVLTSRKPSSVMSREWPEVRALRALAQFVERPLRRVTDDAMTRLVRRLLEEHTSDNGHIRRIVERAKGIPLLARLWSLLPIATTVPVGNDESIRPVIAKRLATLSHDELSVLHAASALGGCFDAGIVSAVSPVKEKATVAKTLTKLFDEELIGGEDAAGHYCFAHPEIRAEAYDMIAPAEARKLNLEAARAFAKRERQDVTHHLRLIRLWELGGEHVKAIDVANLAASHAFEWGSFREAVPLLMKCREIAAHKLHGNHPTTGDLVRWCHRLADAHNGLGQVESRRVFAWEALRRAGAPRPRTRAGLAWAALGMGCRIALTPKADTRPYAKDMAGAYRRSMEGSYFGNQKLGLLHDTLGAIILGLEAKTDVGGVYAALGGGLAVAGAKWGLRWFGEHILNAGWPDRAYDAPLAYTYMIRGLYFVGRGRWDLVEKNAQLCQDLCVRKGEENILVDPGVWMYAHMQRFWLHYYQGDNERASKVGEELEERARDNDNAHQIAVALECRSLCDLRFADDRAAHESDRESHLNDAVARIDEAIENLRIMIADNVQMSIFAICALAQYKRGRIDEGAARTILAQKFLGSNQLTLAHGLLEGYSALFRVVLGKWRADPPAARRVDVARCLRMLKTYSKNFPIGTPRYWLHYGDYCALAPFQMARAKARAASYYIRGERAAMRLGMSWDAQRCRVALENLY